MNGFGPVRLVCIERLLCHERTVGANTQLIKRSMEKAGYFGPPVLVEKNHLIILDGHHRARALDLLGASMVPAFLVDYSEIQVTTFSGRAFENIREEVVRRALAGKPFPSGTTYHLYPKPAPVRFAIKELI